MSNYTTGHQAEVTAANYLKTKDFSIHMLNWKTKYCEIDIVAQKDQRLYFVEVKYRRKSTWGNALDYITPTKLRRMRFAAEAWVKAHGWQGEYQLGAVSIDGDNISFTAIST